MTSALFTVGRCVGWAAEHLEELWPMCSHALSVMVLTLTLTLTLAPSP